MTLRNKEYHAHPPDLVLARDCWNKLEHLTWLAVGTGPSPHDREGDQQSPGSYWYKKEKAESPGSLLSAFPLLPW